MGFFPGVDGERVPKVHEEAIRKADVLIEAMGYFRQFHGKFTVIKLGGSVMENPEALRALLVDVVFMQTVGMRPVVVHGGGKAITFAMEQAGLEARWVQGRRYTDDATLSIVARVLAEEINEDIVRHIRKFGGRASGLHHKTHQCLYGNRLTLPDGDGNPIDLGRVGEVTEVDAAPIVDLCLAGVVPVLPSLAEDDDGGLLNVNADTAAAAVAMTLEAEKLVFLTDTPGILRDRLDSASLFPSLTPEDCQDLIAQGIIDKGNDPQGRGEPCQPGRRGQEGPRHRRPGPALALARNVHDHRGRHRDRPRPRLERPPKPQPDRRQRRPRPRANARPRERLIEPPCLPTIIALKENRTFDSPLWIFGRSLRFVASHHPDFARNDRPV